ncbi:non-ribosomal peptide synthetase [Alteromonas sp. a30]|uniref:non-ribosomal peptide synthetase n=1 Tax=Alteromonas sp. a30 TaxID=2730917 RepID=UPI002281E190|nr:non-ribosomal peptide synthetase [Alteromonas sp. a30]MCY7295530.1 amino acid adenylation domain-containing protein [Alteromonas sp. a30]
MSETIKAKPEDEAQSGISLNKRQLGLWLIQQKSPQNGSYNVSTAFRIKSELPLETVSELVIDMFNFFPAFRTEIYVDKGTPMQRVLPRWTGAVNIFPLSKKLTIEQQLEKLNGFPFDFNSELPSRINLIEGNPGEIVIQVVFHHIVADGTTARLIAQRLYENFQIHINNAEIESLPTAVDTYFEAVQRHDNLAPEAMQYWKDKLTGISLHVDLASQANAQEGVSSSSDKSPIGSLEFELDSRTSADILSFSKKHRSTPFCFFSAVYSILINRCFRANDFALGYLRDIRAKKDARIAGFFVEHIPLPVSITDELTGIDMLQKFRQDLLAHRNEGDVSAVAVLEQYREGQAPRGRELNVTIGATIFSSYTFGDPDKDGFSMTSLPISTGELEADLALLLDTSSKNMRFRINYDANLFNSFTIQAMETTLYQLIEEMLYKGDQPVNSWELINEDEKELLLPGYGLVERDFGDYKIFPEVFVERVQEQPDALAIIDGDDYYTYQQVHELVNVVSNTLIQSGIKSGDNVALCMQRGIRMVTSILGVHKAGGTYIPLDPTFPPERLHMILDDSEVKAVVLQEDFREKLSKIVNDNVPMLNVQDMMESDDPALCKDSPMINDNPVAVVLYTSGSTGRPKGVEIGHLALLNILHDLEYRFPMEQGDRHLLKTNYVFDVSINEMFSWFMGRGTLVILPPDTERDLEFVINYVNDMDITHVIFVHSMLTAIIDYLADKPRSVMFPKVKHLTSTGEKFTRTTFDRIKELGFNHLSIENLYGPTEAAIYCSHYPILEWTKNSRNVPIGRPIANIRNYIVDEQMKLLPPGFAGELCVAGAGLAFGYRNLPEKTAEAFVDNPFAIGKDTRLYRTGDSVRIMEDGNIEYFGRIDTQVKIRGLRIELGEIEERMRQHPIVSEAVAVVKQTNTGPAIVAYYSSDDGEQTRQVLTDYLNQYLAPYMIPQYFVYIEKMPTTATGKLDRKGLELMPLEEKQSDIEVDESDDAGGAPVNTVELENKLLQIWQEVLQKKSVGANDNFFELGGHSLLITKVTQKIEEKLGMGISVTDFFRFPNIRELTSFLASQHDVSDMPVQATQDTLRDKEEDIAVIGLACRYPGAKDADAFWDNLVNGVEGILEFTNEELSSSGELPTLYKHPNYVKRKGMISGAKEFDANFFNYSPREAEILDPQQRLFLEEAFHALEDGGYGDISQTQNVGVYGGSGFNYYTDNLNDYMRHNKSVTSYQVMVGNANDFLCTRVAYKLNLCGPAITMQTACSTSLVAIERACADLREGRCDMALAGGVSLISGVEISGYMYREGMILSPDGHCRTFDSQAKGTVPSQGVGLVLLKPLSQALKDGDHIRAIVKGAAINNDANAKVGYTAPGIDGQRDVIRTAQIRAGIDPASISYIEAHGTATPMGDPIEISALSMAFNESKEKIERASCAIGSVKSNIGHSDTAAGVAGLIKTVLCLEHGTLVPSLHYKQPNPNIDFGPFHVNTETREWTTKANTPRRAGVSAFGIGGTNAHIVLEQAPEKKEKPTKNKAKTPFVCLPLSGASNIALNSNVNQLNAFLDKGRCESLEGLAYTLQRGRHPHRHRKLALAPYLDNVSALTSSQLIMRTEKDARFNDGDSIAYVFAEEPSESHINTLQQLASEVPVYQAYVQKLVKSLKLKWQTQMANLMESAISDDIAQKACLSAIYSLALANLMRDFGLQPKAIVGSGYGQIIAAVFAGLIKPDVALSLFTDGEVTDTQIKANASAPIYFSALEMWHSGQVELDLNSLNVAAKVNIDQALVAEHLGADQTIQLFNPTVNTEAPVEDLYHLFADVWCMGAEVNWDVFYQNQHPQRVKAPLYAFDKKQYWVADPKLTGPDRQLWSALVNRTYSTLVENEGLVNNMAFIQKQATKHDAALVFMARALNRIAHSPVEFGQPYSVEQLNLNSVVEKYQPLVADWVDELNTYIDRVHSAELQKAIQSDEELESFIVQLRQLWDDEQAYISRIIDCGHLLSDILDGKVEAINVLSVEGEYFNAFGDEKLVENSPQIQYCNLAVSSMLDNLLRQLPKDVSLKVLEIGGGSGYATKEIMPKLTKTSCQYSFTDTNDILLERAGKRYAEYDYFTSSRLDIEFSPQAQGYPENNYDVVVVGNSLYNVRNIDEALAHVHSLLAPGGMLIMWEITSPQLEFAITESLMMNPIHDGLRSQANPFIGVDALQEKLYATGFEQVEPLTPAEHSAHSVLIAKAGEPQVKRAFSYSTGKDYRLQTNFVGCDITPLNSTQEESASSHLSVAEIIANLWCEHFNIEEVNPEDNFFDLGGESLMALGLIDDINEAFELTVAVNTLYEVPTLSALSEFVAGQLPETSHQIKQDKPKSTQDRVNQLWLEHLNLSELNPDDDFFDLGGDSLIALGMIEDINNIFSTDISANILYDNPTLSKLTELVQHNQQQKTTKSAAAKAPKAAQKPAKFTPLVQLQQGTNEDLPPIFFVHAAGGGLILFSRLVAALGKEYTVYGFESPPDLPQNSIEELADTYLNALMQKFPFKQSFIIGGHSFGPVVALEISRKLIEFGKTVESMILIDPPGPGKMPKHPENYTDILLHLNDDIVKLDKQYMLALPLEEQISYFHQLAGETLWKKHFSIITPAFVTTFKKQLDMLQNYTFAPLDCEGIYFTPSQSMPLLPKDMYTAWESILEGQLEVVEVEGNHISMIENPGAITIADRIKAKFS